jgi:ketosteroid isomerase-like protein
MRRARRSTLSQEPAMTTQSATDLVMLQALNRDYINSVQKGDVRRFNELLAEDYYCSNPDGSLADRSAFLEQTAKPVTISNLRADNVLIRFFGDIAIIHGRTSYNLPDGSAAQGRYTDVWSREGNTWKTVSAHVTRA